jgi:uncharacterized protein (DUF885 family)
MHFFAKLGLLLCCLGISASGWADWITESNRYAMDVLKAAARYQPENIAGYGLEEFDGEIIDLGPDLHERRLASSREQLARLSAAMAAEKNPRVRQDLEILQQAIAEQVETEQIDHRYLLPYYNLHQYLFGSFNSLLDKRNDPARFPRAMERLRKYTGTEKGYEPLTDLARKATEARFPVKGLLGPYRGELEADIANAGRMVTGIGELFRESDLTGWEPEFAVLEKQLAAYKAWLETEMLPRARADNQLPEVVYANRLKGYGVQSTPEELITRAQYSYQLIRSEMKALAWRIAEQRGWKDKDLVTVIRRLKKEQVPQDQLLGLYKKRLAAVEEIIRREDMLTLPDRDASIRLATEAESAAIPASFMSPPQLINNTGQYGEFVLVTSNPGLEGDEALMDDWSHDAMTWALTVHEARPGHELQFARLVEDGTSLARAIFAFNSANAEGWGLYAESIMQEFLPLEGQLFNLYTRLMRAARMFLDPMVNTGQLSHEEVVAFLTGQAAMSLPMASSEADRYTFRAPGQATAYYYGYMSLMQLRTEVEIARGDTFNQREFHDFILRQGLLPPELLREAVLDQFVRGTM